jgi:YihY family inner membrane protein
MWKEALVEDWERIQRRRVTPGNLVALFRPSVSYLFETEVHAYAFSIAANAYLSFFPFVLILLAICRRWLHWEKAYLMVIRILVSHLPLGTESVVRSLVAAVQGRSRLQLVSVFMLFFTVSGVFLPLEIALNKVWGFKRNRSFLKNQIVSLVLALALGIVALTFIMAVTPIQSAIDFLIGWIPSRTFVSLVSNTVVDIASVPFVASIYFVIYYFLPNGKVPIARVFPTAIATGILTEVGGVIYALTKPMVHFREVYGSFALSATLLFWAYVGSLILLFGAHLSAHMFISDVTAPAAAAPVESEKLEGRSQELEAEKLEFKS